MVSSSISTTGGSNPIHLVPSGLFRYLPHRNSWLGMTHAHDFPRFSPGVRLIAAGVGLGILLLLVTASRLTPDPRGVGTHEQLGLTPCSFYRWTGRLCPTCGATTAWAYLLDGDWARAVRANLAGTVLCCAAIVSVPWLLMSTIAGRWLIIKPTARGLLVTATAVAVVAVIDWFGRVWL